MTITDYYVTATAAGHGDGSLGNPYTLSEALQFAISGDRMNIKFGDYTLSQNTQPTFAGSLAAPIVFRGYRETPGDGYQGRSSQNYKLVTTHMPTITISGDYWLHTKSLTIFQNLNIILNSSSGVVGVVDGSAMHGCSITQEGKGVAVYLPSGAALVFNCDITNANEKPTDNTATLTADAVDASLIANFIDARNQPRGVIIRGGAKVVNNLITGGKLQKILIMSNGSPFIMGNTMYGAAGERNTTGIGVGSPPLSTITPIYGNLISDQNYGIDTADAAGPAISLYNRVARSGSSAFSGSKDWLSAAATGDSTEAVTLAQEFSDVNKNDFTLESTSPALEASFPQFASMGAFQPKAGTTGGGASPKPCFL